MADVTKRMNYFDRQFLRATDFQDEQAYDLDRRRRHNRLLHAPGIAEGLEVTGNINDAFVTVSPGTAYDALGQEIVLAASEQVSVSTIAGTTAYITIAYGEQASDPSADPGVAGNSTRTTEQPSLAASATPPVNPNLLLPLTRITLANGKVSATPDNTVRNQAGTVVAPDLTLHSVTLRNDTVAASTWPRLICSGANTAALQNAGLTIDASREVLFVDNGQIRSHDDGHRVVFNRQNNLLELHEAGDIVLMTGGASPTEKMRVTAAGNVGIGTPNPSSKLEVTGDWSGQEGALRLTGDKPTIKFAGGPVAGNQSWILHLGSDGPGNLAFYKQGATPSSWTEVMALTPSGNVGIGTTTPGARFETVGRIIIRQGADQSAGLWLFQTTPNALQAFVGMALDGFVGFFGNTGAGWGLVMDTGTGNVGIGIGVTEPAAKLDVGGVIHCTTTTNSSDERFKTNIAPLTDTLKKIDSIRGITFDWNELHQSLGRSTGRRKIGVIAQDLEKPFPELVSTWDEKGYRAVDYGRFTAVLLEAIKEIKAKNESLERRVAALENSFVPTSKGKAPGESPGRGAIRAPRIRGRFLFKCRISCSSLSPAFRLCPAVA
jgi:hypothetical protein